MPDDTAPPFALGLSVVSTGGARASEFSRSAGEVAGLGADVAATLAWARGEANTLRAGSHVDRWEALATLASIDVAAARMVEPHLDALMILDEAGMPDLGAVGADGTSTWGVYAAEGAGTRVEAVPRDGGWALHGTKPWCSLAQDLSHALVTAWVSPEERALFAVDLRARSVTASPGPWVARGLPGVVSAPVAFDDTRAVPVGEPGWYLRRPGFAWGGVGVAAAWLGGVLPVVRAVARAAARPDADQLADVFLGDADTAVFAARAALREAAAAADAGGADDPGLVAARARAIVAASVERVLAVADRALGPGPLATDEAHARRVADLRMYVRQHHGERDLARVGRKAASTWV